MRVCCHSNEARAPIADPPNSAQLEGTSYHSLKLHSDLCTVRGCGEGQTDRHRDTQTHRRPWPIYTSPGLCLRRNAV